MKNFVTTIFLLLAIGSIALYHENIIDYLMTHIVYKDEVIVKEANQYERKSNWQYVQQTEQFQPQNKQDILNIFYTALNKGWDEIIFYCPKEYKNCLDEVGEITKDDYTLSYVNNFVPTFNSYNKIYVNMNSLGRVNIQIEKIYTPDMIASINKKIDDIIHEVITDNMSPEEKIKAIHDYIINHTIYDDERSNQIKNGQITDYVGTSNTAYGPLFLGKAICGGYTDAMALFLDRFGIPNYKISSDNHIWNFVYINGSWKHLDLTWDDPVVNTGENMLLHTFYLISTSELKTKDTSQHVFDANIFREAQ